MMATLLLRSIIAHSSPDCFLEGKTCKPQVGRAASARYSGFPGKLQSTPIVQCSNELEHMESPLVQLQETLPSGRAIGVAAPLRSRCSIDGKRLAAVFGLLLIVALPSRASDEAFATNARLLVSARNADSAGVERALR